jgi:hypothetical protein
MGVAAACDFLTVPALTFKVLYAFVVLSHDRRRILHVNVTPSPTAEWTAQQITEAFPGDAAMPRYLHRDRDSVYGDAFQRRVAALRLREIVNAKQCPWQNPFAERVIGSIRRECLDHVIALGEHHLRQVLRAYADYYNGSRCHMSLEGNAPSRERSRPAAAPSAPSPTSADCTTVTRALREPIAASAREHAGIESVSSVSTTGDHARRSPVATHEVPRSFSSRAGRAMSAPRSESGSRSGFR